MLNRNVARSKYVGWTLNRHGECAAPAYNAVWRQHTYPSPCRNSSDLYQFQERSLAKVGWTLSPYSHTFIIGSPSPTHSFTLGLNPSFSTNPPYRTLSFFSFKIHYMDFPDYLLLCLSISVFLLFSFFSVFTLF